MSEPAYWPAKCFDCGWTGMSDELGGFQPIADTGDYDSPYCPKCHGSDIEDAEHLNPRPLTPKATVRDWRGCLVSWGLGKRRAAILMKEARSMERYYRRLDRKERKVRALRRPNCSAARSEVKHG